MVNVRNKLALQLKLSKEQTQFWYEPDLAVRPKICPDYEFGRTGRPWPRPRSVWSMPVLGRGLNPGWIGNLINEQKELLRECVIRNTQVLELEASWSNGLQITEAGSNLVLLYIHSIYAYLDTTIGPRDGSPPW